jgi:hypothetical protein
LTSQNKDLKHFSEFFNSLLSAKHDQFRSNKEANVVDETAFSKMREYLIGHYQGVEVLHSFVDDGGVVFDCIPVEQQPSIKGSGQKVMNPPDFPTDITTKVSKMNTRNDSKTVTIQAPLEEGRKDRFGNAMFCPPGTIPKRRITLEDLSLFKTLKNYFQKSPFNSSLAPDADTETDEISQAPTTGHKYAIGRQIVRNFGGYSALRINQPTIDIQKGQIFSLSQQWYAAGSGSTTQTIEVGWQVNPARFHTIFPVFFIYWTADNYQTTGCYNLDCTGFVQTNNSWTLGGALKLAPGGFTTEFGLSFKAIPGGVWWLYVIDTSNGKWTAIGYYPYSIFKKGALADCATRITYGGETAGTTSWPSMGTGYFGTGEKNRSPPPLASYHRTFSYFDIHGDFQPANLIANSPSPKCYDSMIKNQTDQGPTLYYGGPGGTDCESQ